jgi:hypothetical protein
MDGRARDLLAKARRVDLDGVAKHLGLKGDAQRIIELMGDVTLTMIRLHEIMCSDDPEGRAAGVKKMYRLRELMTECFDFGASEPGPMFDMCIRCEREGLDLSACRHHDIGRLALLALPALRIYPEVDLDVMAELDAETDESERNTTRRPKGDTEDGK